MNSVVETRSVNCLPINSFLPAKPRGEAAV